MEEIRDGTNETENGETTKRKRQKATSGISGFKVDSPIKGLIRAPIRLSVYQDHRSYCQQLI